MHSRLSTTTTIQLWVAKAQRPLTHINSLLRTGCLHHDKKQWTPGWCSQIHNNTVHIQFINSLSLLHTYGVCSSFSWLCRVSLDKLQYNFYQTFCQRWLKIQRLLKVTHINWKQISIVSVEVRRVTITVLKVQLDEKIDTTLKTVCVQA